MGKLRDFVTSQENVLIKTMYGIVQSDTFEDDDDYDLSETGRTTLSILRSGEDDTDEAIVADEIEMRGAVGEENGEIIVYDGNVTSVSGITENCTVYAPLYWQ